MSNFLHKKISVFLKEEKVGFIIAMRINDEMP
jgi:hypothetical protein